MLRFEVALCCIALFEGIRIDAAKGRVAIDDRKMFCSDLMWRGSL